MISAFIHVYRLLRGARVLAAHDVLPDDMKANLPGPAQLGLALLGLGGGRHRGKRAERLSDALAALGPSYIKLGQFLATRPDIIGRDMASDLAALHDRLPPFGTARARQIIETTLGAPADTLFGDLSEPVAAASIAQVHKATVRDGRKSRAVAVKILRPGVRRRFKRDLESFFFAARLAERTLADARRLRPVAAVDTLARSVELEMDLRLEAAAMSELAENIAGDEGFRVPEVDWARTSKRVLTTGWVDGIALNDRAAIKKAGHDFKAISRLIIQSFLRHAMRDGFFHADMHPGNLFVARDGALVAVDFGIMGRLGPKERRFLAEILYGFINRDYLRVAQVHFDAGYVPADQSPEVFAQALRAIGEPLMERDASEISMARLLDQLFEVTGQFNMHTQPQLLLLQKTMVVVEGVARDFDPRLNMWTISEPVVKDWMERKLGPEGRLQDAAEGAAGFARLLAEVPELLAGAERLGLIGGDGFRGLSPADRTPDSGHLRAPLWVGAIALAAIAIALIF